MAKKMSIVDQIMGILEDAGRPLFLGEIVAALGEDFDGPYVMANVSRLISRKKISCNQEIREGKGRKVANVYFINEEKPIF